MTIYPGSFGPSGNPSPRALGWLRRVFLSDKRNNPVPGTDKLFVYRGGEVSRGLANQQDCIDFMTKRGFFCVEPGRLSLQEQVSLFSGARIVVGLHGAAMANLAFCPDRGALKVIEFVPKSWANGCYWALSELLGAMYVCVFVDVDPVIQTMKVDLPQLGEVLDHWEGL